MLPRLMLSAGIIFAAFCFPREDRPALQDKVLVVSSPEMTAWDHVNLQANLRWILQRERKTDAAKAKESSPIVGVFADAGVWHLGAKSIVDCLESQGMQCKVLDRSLMTADQLRPLKAIILPGGWAPYQWNALTEPGLDAIRTYVKSGGRCLAICAGAYLVSKTTQYDGQSYPYPLGLFNGTAQGPVDGLAKFPSSGPVRLTVTGDGKAWGLEAIAKRDSLYGGGPRFIGGRDLVPLLRYPDKTVAAAAVKVDKGVLVMIGVHLERSADGKEDSPPPDIAGPVLKALLVHDFSTGK